MVFRVLKHDTNNIVLPAGIGLVEHPAAHVKGLEIINLDTEAQSKGEEDNEDQGTNKKEKHMKKNYGYCPDCNEASDDSEMENEMVTCGKCGKKTDMANWSKDKVEASNIKKLTLSDIIKAHGGPMNMKDIMAMQPMKSVIQTKDLKNMNKPKTLKELTEANVKELSLAEFNDLVADALREANTKYEADTNQYKNGIEQLTKEKEELAASVSENSTKLTEAQAELNQLKEQFNKLVEANTIREQELKFNERMTAVASKFDLSDKQKEVVVNRIKTIKTDEEFVAYASELELFIVKGKEISTASVTNTDNVVKDGVDNASKENVVIPNTQTAPVDFMTMAKKAFSKENLVITYSK
jgi:hypothetical protein